MISWNRYFPRIPLVTLLYCGRLLLAQTAPEPAAAISCPQQQEQPVPLAPDPLPPTWHYGAFVDLGYLLDFDHPANGVFRSRGTTPHVDDVDLNMAAAYFSKKMSENSRWGFELTAQAGKDSEAFAFSATAPNLSGYRWLRHLGPTDVSYLARVGNGLTLQGGIFSSLIGYDSLYAKDNFSYTR